MQLDNLHSQNVEKDILATHLATVLENLEDDRIQLQSLRQDRDESRHLSTDVIDKYKAGKVKGSDDFMAAYLSIVMEQKFISDHSGVDRLQSSQIFESPEFTRMRDLMSQYQVIIEEIKFTEFRHNAHNETMESDLWKNGFYDVA
jgi:hypothetical protein